MSDPRIIYLNPPQRTAHLVNAHEHYHVWGRGTGKTEGPIALRSINANNKMPRGATGMVAATYMQILTRTLPPLEKAWQRYGYMPGIHYWVGEYPDKKLKIPRALYHPRNPKHSIFWWNGHVTHFMSLDRPGLANGKTVDSIHGDEARFLNFQRYLDDIAPTNRGNREIFGHLPEHHQITFCTDQPHDQSGKWILEKQQEMNPKVIEQIINLQLTYNGILNKLKSIQQLTEGEKAYLQRKLREYGAALDELRKGAVFYSEATSLDNIAILGEEQFAQWRREMKPAIYDRAILNKKIIQIEGGFYNLLNLDRHCYDAYDYSYIDNNLYKQQSSGIWTPDQQVKPDSRCDADVQAQQPLGIAFDCNGYFNCCVVGQHGSSARLGKHYNMLRSFYVKDEERLEELCKQVITYYAHHPTKELNFYYDHTFTWTDSTRIESYADLIAKYFRNAGWKVKLCYIGQQPGHDSRYRMWSDVFKEQKPGIPKVRINRTGCDQLLIALQRTGTLKGKGEDAVQKDKRPEARKDTYPPEEATHLTDACDTLFIGEHRNQIGKPRPKTHLLFS